MATDKIVRLSNLKTFLTKLDSRFQKALKFDTTPTANSKNPVTSGGVYDALGPSLFLKTRIAGNGWEPRLDLSQESSYLIRSQLTMMSSGSKKYERR